MNQEKMTFQFQRLEVDFLTLSMKNLSDRKKIQKFADYLFQNFGFNSFLSDGNTRIITQTLYQDLDIKSTVIIRSNYWDRTVIEFPGKSAQKIYQLIKSHQFDWKFFHTPSLSLTRFDLCYHAHKTEFFNSREFDHFLVDSRNHIMDFTRTNHIKLINNTRGRILGINKRSNPRYLRVYETPSMIRFELELKGLALAHLQDNFLNSQFNFFESQLTQFYFQYAKTFFPLDSHFVSWLIDFFRKYHRDQKDSKVLFNTEYFMGKEIKDYEQFYNLLQFLNFTKTLTNENCPQHFLEGRTYYIHNIAIKDFMHFMGISIRKQNIRVRVIEYLRNLYKLGPIIEEFEDGTFRIFATFLYSDVYKKSNCWFLRVYIIQDLYEHAYPFMFSQSFRSYNNLTDCFFKTKANTGYIR